MMPGKTCRTSVEQKYLLGDDKDLDYISFDPIWRLPQQEKATQIPTKHAFSLCDSKFCKKTLTMCLALFV